MVYVNIHLLHPKSPNNAYKVVYISLSKRIFKDVTAWSGNLGVFNATAAKSYNIALFHFVIVSPRLPEISAVLVLVNVINFCSCSFDKSKIAKLLSVLQRPIFKWINYLYIIKFLLPSISNNNNNNKFPFGTKMGTVYT